MKIEDIDKRLQEIPLQIEQLKAEHNQLLGYKQALMDVKQEDNAQKSGGGGKKEDKK